MSNAVRMPMIDAVIAMTGKDPYQVELFREVNGVRAEDPEAAWVIPADLDTGDVPAVVAGDAIAKNILEFIANEPSSDEFAGIGDYLGRLLLPDNGPRAAWKALKARRTRLEIEPRELRSIPWELARCGRALFLSPEHPFVRSGEHTAPPGCGSLPLRLLVVEGVRSSGIGTAEEIRAIKSSLANASGWIEAEFLHEPSRHELQVTYERFKPQVFHFIGHCREVIGSNQSALWTGPEYDEWPIRAQEIADLLVPAPRLAVLNACGTAREAEHLDALTDAFVHNGAAAVLGTHGEVLGSAARVFGGELYRSLAAGAAVDEAVVHARKRIYTDNGGADARDWFLPSLTLHAAPTDVLPEICPGDGAELVKSIGTFVDRVEERHLLAGGADPEEDADAKKLLLVTGDKEAGKTSLVNWLLRRCVIRGRRVKYVDFNGTINVDFLSALYRIRDTREVRPRRYQPGRAPFDRFNYDLGYFAEGRFPAEPDDGEVVTLASAPCPPGLTDPAVGLVENVFQSFRNALGAETQDGPLVLVLDHVEMVPCYEFRNHLLPHLIQPLLDGAVQDLRLVVVLREDKLDEYWPHERRGLRVGLDSFPLETFGPLIEDLLLATGQAEQPTIDMIKKAALMSCGPGPVKPKSLDLVLAFANMGRN